MKKFLLIVVFLFGIIGVGYIYSGEDSVLEVPGRIAYVGFDHNVYTVSLNGEDGAMLTDDGGQSRRYQWPTWSTNGKLAYFCCQPIIGATAMTEVFVSSDGIEPGQLVFSGEDKTFTYAYWSPEDCAAGESCRDLAVLVSEVDLGLLSVQLVRSREEGASTEPIGFGSPFYYSWSPDGTQMLWQRNTQQLAIYDLETDSVDRMDQRPGRFQAPAWSPVDNRLLFGMLDTQDLTTDLVMLAEDELQVLEEGLTGIVSFSWSPDGNYIAYRTVDDTGLSPLFIVDAATRETVAQTDVDGVIAFFWSPNSELVAFVTLATPAGSFNLQRNDIILASQRVQETQDLAWSVIEVESDQTRRYGSFVPTDEMIYLLSFFDQFVQSHQIWSPDSTHIVFAEVTPEDEEVISVLDMTRPDTVPFFVAEGVIGIWSYR